jgi:hypothetical protein
MAYAGKSAGKIHFVVTSLLGVGANMLICLACAASLLSFTSSINPEKRPESLYLKTNYMSYFGHIVPLAFVWVLMLNMSAQTCNLKVNLVKFVVSKESLKGKFNQNLWKGAITLRDI